ncbi:cyclin-domain-containing protein [Sordaria brevicollis]|uniref:Cyclin-domain-containing protein n=1 Tax=Sordaria brevicollis TaxID=83679 RepID=A0AAE0PC81_SORBR|nr:cyclin-domain-containing protein [Sordaria brevicollis]
MMLTRSPVSATATATPPSTTVTATTAAAAATSPRPSRGALHGRFHYAPTPSPREAASRIPALSSRRQSTAAPATSSTSLSVPIQTRHAPPEPVASYPPETASSNSSPSPGSPSSTRPRRWAGVDVATQYSPMEPMDYQTGTLLSSRTPVSSNDQAAARNLVESQPSHIPTTSAEPMASHQGQASASTSISQAAAVPPTPPVSSTAPQPHSVSQTPQTGTPGKRRNSQDDVTHNQVEAARAGHNGPHSPKRARLAPKVVPRRYEHCPVEDLVVLISHMLGELIELNDEQAQKAGQRHNLTRFHSRTAPGISVLDYLHRLAKHAYLSPPILLSMVYYIDRLCALYSDFTINTLTVHRFLITAATVAAKGLSDSFLTNTLYARVGGVRVAELNMLELEFLHRVDWKIVPDPDVLVAYYGGLVARCPGYAVESLEPEEAEDDDEDDELDESDAIGDDDDEIDGEEDEEEEMR